MRTSRRLVIALMMTGKIAKKMAKSIMLRETRRNIRPKAPSNAAKTNRKALGLPSTRLMIQTATHANKAACQPIKLKLRPRRKNTGATKVKFPCVNRTVWMKIEITRMAHCMANTCVPMVLASPGITSNAPIQIANPPAKARNKSIQLRSLTNSFLDFSEMSRKSRVFGTESSDGGGGGRLGSSNTLNPNRIHWRGNQSNSNAMESSESWTIT